MKFWKGKNDKFLFSSFWRSPILAALLWLTPSQPGNTEPERRTVANLNKNISSCLNSCTQAQSPNQNQLAQAIQQGTQISLNGRILPVAWTQLQSKGASKRIGISDTGIMQAIGLELLNTNNSAQQPVQWFSQSLTLRANFTGQYRYLDITDFAKQSNWQMQVDGDTLRISSPATQIADIRQGEQPWGNRIVVDLDRPTPWKVNQQAKEAIITIEASASPTLIQRFAPPPPPLPNPQLPILTPNSQTKSQNSLLTQNLELKPQNSLIVEGANNQTTIRIPLQTGWRPKVSTLSNPNRIVIDIAPDAFVARDILWTPGVRWRQQFVNLGSDRFPVVSLEVNLRQRGITLKPIINTPASLVGIAPLVKFAATSRAAAAINAGFFNRKQQLPLGAIRQNNRWLSSPILNRGAIAWNNAGEVKIARLTLQETLITSSGQRLPVLYLNSGYVQAGISRYTPEWGATYTPLINDEILVVVQKNQITSQIPGGEAGKNSFPIPSDGYLLTLRGIPEVNALLVPNTTLQLESIAIPSEFSRYPQILGAGPLLVQNRQIVLDAKAEKFSNEFIREMAIRSAVGTTASGNLLFVAVHNRAGGTGPTLAEIAQLMQQMGVIDALNLDGGSSTSLYLGGQLINRSPSTAARVHNGIGIFIQPGK